MISSGIKYLFKLILPKNKVLSFYDIVPANISSPPTYNNNVGSIDSPVELLSINDTFVLELIYEVIDILWCSSGTIISLSESPGPLTAVSEINILDYVTPL